MESGDGRLAHPCSLLCCAGNQNSEAAMAPIQKKLEHNKRILRTLSLFFYMLDTSRELTAHHMQGMLG